LMPPGPGPWALQLIGTAGSDAKCALWPRPAAFVINYATEDFLARVKTSRRAKVCQAVYDSVGSRVTWNHWTAWPLWVNGQQYLWPSGHRLPGIHRGNGGRYVTINLVSSFTTGKRRPWPTSL
jgi:hypothetical protein